MKKWKEREERMEKDEGKKYYWKQGKEIRKESIGNGMVRMESGREEQEEKDSEGEERTRKER